MSFTYWPPGPTRQKVSWWITTCTRECQPPHSLPPLWPAGWHTLMEHLNSLRYDLSKTLFVLLPNDSKYRGVIFNKYNHYPGWAYKASGHWGRWRERKNIQVSKTSSPYLWNTERLFPILISCVPDSVGVERAIVEEVCGRGYNKYLSPSNTARSFNCIKAEINSCRMILRFSV